VSLVGGSQALFFDLRYRIQSIVIGDLQRQSELHCAGRGGLLLLRRRYYI